MLIHIFWNFHWYMKIQYDFFIFIIFERLGRMHENKKYIFLMFWRKPGILISDLYLYSIKIQTNTKQNEVENCVGKSQIFLKKIFFFFLGFFYWAGPGPKENWADISPKIKWGLLSTWLGWCSSPKQRWTGYCAWAQ
jgi:hypothetical protein